MKRVVPALAVVVAGFSIWAYWPENQTSIPQPPGTPNTADTEELTPMPVKILPGDKILRDYGTDRSDGKNDLILLSRLIDSSFLLVKNRDTREYATNEDLVDFLQGQNAYRELFLPKNSPALNLQGQLIDRWGTPIIVHPVSRKTLELRSAGPDQAPYTEDDLSWPDSP